MRPTNISNSPTKRATAFPVGTPRNWSRATKGYCRRKQSTTAFSLVEIVIGLAVISFTFVTLIGLLAIGSLNFRNANTTSVTTQIAQHVINEVQQTDFNSLTNTSNLSGGGPTYTLMINSQKIRYFDDQGDEMPASEKATSVYQVNTRIYPSPALPQTDGTLTCPNMAIVTVQVANVPGGSTLTLGTTAPFVNLWSTPANSISTFGTVVAQNKNL
jgi:uncharacterized protein (TIGR02598 family)